MTKIFYTIQKAVAAILLLLLAIPVLAQEGYQVNGTITDMSGQPLVGVTVMEQGSTRGTSSNDNGLFTLSVSSRDANIIFSYPTYTTLTLKASDVPATVQMGEEAQSLNEVVVIGYGTQRKKEVTGAVSSVKEEDFNSGIKNSPMGLLQGKVAGLTVSRVGGGDPTNTEYKIQIRGFSTLDKGAGTSPLYIVDGIPVNNIPTNPPKISIARFTNACLGVTMTMLLDNTV